MRTVRTFWGEYFEEDIYCVDETSLFWRYAPFKSPESERNGGIENNKSRISLVVCLNSTGYDRLPIWVIGKTQKPRALKKLNLQAMGLEWRANEKAMLSTIIMCDWLKMFYASIQPSRSVLLLMDQLETHVSGV